MPRRRRDRPANELGLSMDSSPATTDDKGEPGEMRSDGSYIYACVAPDKWKRTKLTGWPVNKS